jgi:hypothetical protein
MRRPGESYSDVILRLAKETTTAMSDESPLTPEERQRRVVRLCCMFMRSLAFFRAGLQPEVPPKLFARTHPQGWFWRGVHGNFMDMCVLDWCKLFADYKSEHHWHRVVDDRVRFKKDLCAALGIRSAEFTKMIKEVEHYRNKFVAHLDEERVMRFPKWELPKKAVAFLHEHLAQQAHSHEDWRRLGLPATAEEMDRGSARSFQEAQSVYAEAMAPSSTGPKAT